MKRIVCCVTLLFSFAVMAQVPNDQFYSKINPYYRSGNVGECTWFVWGRVYANDGIQLPDWGNAGSWFGAAASSNYKTGNTPIPHSIAVWTNGGPGHVAYIEKIEGGLVYFSQANLHGKAENDGISSRKPEDMAKLLSNATIHYIYLNNSPNLRGNASTPAPILTIVPTIVEPTGTFTIDLYGDNFQPNARVFGQKFVAGVQNPNWYSGDIIVKFMGPKHLQATLSATAPFEFTISVRNPDMQISASQPIRVVAGPATAPTPNAGHGSNNSANGSVQTVDNKPPLLRFPSGEAISLKAGEATQITGVDFVQGSRVVLLQQAPGAPELILANLNADAKGTIQWNYQSTCDSKNGKYVIRALDQQMPGAAPGTKSNSVTISIDGKSSNCSSILGINTAQASNQGGASAQSAGGASAGPSLDSVSPTNHPPGQFGIDLYGNGFQQGAKVVAQGSDWNSDKAAVTFLGSNHLRAIIVASNPGQFVVTVRNPDGQVSASRSFDVTVSNTPLTKGTTATTPNRGQPIGNNSNSTITMAPNPGSNGTNAKPPVSGAADSKPTNSSTGSTVSSPGGLQSPLSNSAGRVTLANPPTSTISDTSKKQVSNTPKPAIVGAPAQGSGSGSANAVQRINIPPSNTHSADQTGSSFKNTQAKPMVTNGQQPTAVLPRNSGQTLPTGTHNQAVSGQPVTTAVHPEPKRQDIPKPQASPQHSGATPIVHPPTPVPLTTNKPAPVQNTQLPRGPSPTVNTPPPPKPMPPSPQPSSTPANQKPAPPPAKPPSQNQSNDKKKP